MRAWVALVLVWAALSAGMAAAQSSPAWAVRRRARSIAAALGPGVRLTASTPADVDGNGSEDALILLERGESRALAVAWRSGPGWRVTIADERAADPSLRWAAALRTGDQRVLAATRAACGSGGCRPVVDLFVLRRGRVQPAGNVVGAPGERLSVVAEGERHALISSDRGRHRYVGLEPGTARLWLGPWARSLEDAVASRPISTGALSPRLARDGEGVAAYWSNDHGALLLRRFAEDGTPIGARIETGITARGYAVHATPTDDGWAFVLRNDEWESEDDMGGGPACAQSSLEVWRWSPQGATRTDTLSLGRTCEGDFGPISSGTLFASVGASRLDWLAPGHTTFDHRALGESGSGSARLLGVGPESFLVADGARVVEWTLTGATRALAALPGELPRSCAGTERAWACGMPSSARTRVIAVRPHGARGLASARHTATFTHVQPLSEDRVGLRQLNSYDGGGHVALYNVMDLASGRVGPQLHLGRGFVDHAIGGRSRLYVVVGLRLHAIPWRVTRAEGAP